MLPGNYLRDSGASSAAESGASCGGRQDETLPDASEDTADACWGGKVGTHASKGVPRGAPAWFAKGGDTLVPAPSAMASEDATALQMADSGSQHVHVSPLLTTP